MTNRNAERAREGRWGNAVAVLLARLVVPLWLLAGAVLKLADVSPSHLPVPLIKIAGALGLELKFVLQFSIAVELIVVGVMWLLPGLARPVGMAMLALFLPVLVGEVAMGASSCGCFGTVEIHPGITLAMDLGFLLGLWILGRGAASLATPASLPTWRVLAVGLWTLSSIGLAFGLTAGPSPATAAAEEASGPPPIPAEGYYLPRYDQWLGAAWTEVPISAWIQGAPADLDQGAHYILFYRKDCEHCHELMELFFAGPLAIPTTAVAVPDRSGFPTLGVLPFACAECRLAELPAGVDWFLQTPVLVRLGDGVVECAAEVVAESPECLAW